MAGITLSDPHRGLRTWVEISRKAIRHNYRQLRACIGDKTKLLGVVKSNAYGHDLVEFSRELAELGIDMLGVDSAVEGFALRDAGVMVPILVLGHTLPELFSQAAKKNIVITISNMVSLRQIGGLSPLVRPQFHLKVDTGMHRQGFLAHEAEQVIRFIKKKNLEKNLEGMYTHFAAAKSVRTKKHFLYTKQQIKNFEVWRSEITRVRPALCIHAAASGALFLFPDAHFTLARAGISMYGLWPSEEAKRLAGEHGALKPVLSWKSIVAEVKTIPAGSVIGYDMTERVSRATNIAVVPVGYWHGFPRALSGKGEVLVRGGRARVLGRVSMDMIVVDVTTVKGVRAGDEVVLIGVSGKETISAEDVAARAGTSAYEILTRLNPLMRRIYT